MAARKRKPAEAGDGSYAGRVLEAWDQLELFPATPSTSAPELPDGPAAPTPRPHGSFYPWLCALGLAAAELRRLEHKAETLRREGCLTDQQLREDAALRRHNEELLQGVREP